MDSLPASQLALDRLAEGLAMCELQPSSQKAYIATVREFLAFAGYDPDTFTLGQASELEPETFRQYMLSLAQKKLAPSTRNSKRCCIFFFYENVMENHFDRRLIPKAKLRQLFPVYITLEEFYELHSAATCALHRCFLSLAFGCGLRVSEVASLRIGDLLTEDGRRQVHVLSGAKGGKERVTILPEFVLKELREYYKESTPEKHTADDWLFPHAKNPGEHVTPAAISKMFKRLREQCGINPKATFHSLRHGWAVSMINSGCDLNTLRLMLGHSSFVTTARYLQISGMFITAVSPLDHAAGGKA